jgi:predicted AlkP superfamily pyrophosphatase or phosphodiesterase
MKLITFLLVAFFISCTTYNTNNFDKPSTKTNSKASLEKPYVMLISLDGYRADYTDLFKPKHLLQFRDSGLSSMSLIPVFPSKTFPNHYSIVTGLYPENHGIVANQFYDFSRVENRQFYKLSLAKEVTDGSWYGGTPLWVAAEKNNLLSACYFWPGSEATIQDTKPTYYKVYNGNIPNSERIQQVVRWLQMPAEHRPHFLTLYFSDIDTMGHEYGTDSNELKFAIKKVDDELGFLFDEIKKLKLPINIIVVSDHGMTNLDHQKIIYLDDFANFENVTTADSGPQMFIYSHNLAPEILSKIYTDLKKNETNFRVYWRKDLPKNLHFSKNQRAGEIIIVAEPPYSIALRGKNHQIPVATHGFDSQKNKDMHGIFYAMGPNIKNGKMPAFTNIDIYPFILKILNLPQPQKIDGSAITLSPWIKQN